MTIDKVIDEIKRWTPILLANGSKDAENILEAQDKAIKALKFKREHQAKVQKCIEEIDQLAKDAYWISEARYRCFMLCKKIIKEEMGV